MSALAPQLGGKQTPGERAENDANDPEQKSQTKTVRTSDTTQAYESRVQEFEPLRQNPPFLHSKRRRARAAVRFSRP
jgi:hypothetical protein